MGAGDEAAGSLPAGDEEVIVLPGGRVVPKWNAIVLDAQTRDFPQDASGFYVPLHPVDARVELAMIVVQGTVPTLPDLGNAIQNFRYLGSKITATVQQEVRRVLKPETDAKNITIVAINVEVQEQTSLAVELRYVNLRLSPKDQLEQTRRVQLVTNG